MAGDRLWCARRMGSSFGCISCDSARYAGTARQAASIGDCPAYSARVAGLLGVVAMDGPIVGCGSLSHLPLLGAARYLLVVYPAFMVLGGLAERRLSEKQFGLYWSAFAVVNLIWMWGFLNWDIRFV